MAILNDYLVQKFVFENHPSVNEKQCLNVLQTKKVCNECQNICPCSVFSINEPDWDRCDGCGVCVAACPTECIAPAKLHTEQMLESVLNANDTISITCQKHSGSADLTVSCLGALPWEFVTVLALKGRTNFLFDSCIHCKYSVQGEQFTKTIKRVKDFLGSALFDERISFFSSKEEIPEKNISRREAFSMLLSKTKTTAKALLPNQFSIIPDGTLWRQLLIKYIESMEQPATYNWTFPTFTNHCNACGLCEKLCPSKALYRVKDEQRDNLWYMAVIPWRCTDCGLCTDFCPFSGLTKPLLTALPDPKKPNVHPVVANTCIRCKEPILSATQSKLCEKCQGELHRTITL